MVFSGDILIYGIKIDLETICSKIHDYIQQHCKEIYEPFDFDDYNDPYDTFDYLYELIKKLDISVTVIGEKCCYFTSDIYFGIELAYNDIVNRHGANTFNTFEEYIEYYTCGIKPAIESFNINKLKYENDIRKIISGANLLIQFYSIPNDCHSCT